MHKAGPNREIEDWNGIVYAVEDWVDIQMTEYREEDE